MSKWILGPTQPPFKRTSMINVPEPVSVHSPTQFPGYEYVELYLHTPIHLASMASSQIYLGVLSGCILRNINKIMYMFRIFFARSISENTHQHILNTLRWNYAYSITRWLLIIKYVGHVITNYKLGLQMIRTFVLTCSPTSKEQNTLDQNQFCLKNYEHVEQRSTRR
jgi:hypothetical protein